MMEDPEATWEKAESVTERDFVRRAAERIDAAGKARGAAKPTKEERKQETEAKVYAAKDAAEDLRKYTGLDFEIRLKAMAKDLGVSKDVLKKEVALLRDGYDAADRMVIFTEIKPWSESVDGDNLLDQISAIFARYLILPAGAADGLALWTLHAHTHHTAEISPILALTSPTPECGKTTALNLIGALVPKPLATNNITTAAVFRSIEAWAPTLLIDEGDTFLKGNDELRGVLNSGHFRRSAFVIRVVGEGKNMEPARFTTWAPKAIALIGKLPPTLASRSIHVEMRRMTAGESAEPVRLERLDFTEVGQQAARWAKDYAAILKTAEPDIPVSLTGRRADNWRHLFAIADAAGGTWPDRARLAAASLTARDSEQTAGINLLEDIKAIFADTGEDRITSAQLVEKLVDIEIRPWGEWSKGKPITVNKLAGLLAPFHIQPGKVRFGAKPLQGYKLSAFDDAFARYLVIKPEHRNNPQKTAKNQHIKPEHPSEPVPVRTPLKPAENRQCSGVPVENPGNPEEGVFDL